MIRVADEDATLGELRPVERMVLRALDGSRTLMELEQEFPGADVRTMVDQLRQFSLLEDAADEDQLSSATIERLDRQLRYFSEVSQEGGPSFAECQNRLREARVAVLGTGGLGGRTALELAACGVGEIRLIDGDNVEMSNLNRQIQYTEADVGLPKALVMAERIIAFNSRVRVTATCDFLESQEDVAAFIDGATFVIGSADEPAFLIEPWCNAACFAAGIPFIAMNQLPPLIKIGPIYDPGRTGCFNCEVMRRRRDYPLYDTYIEQQTGAAPEAATLGPSSGVIAGFIGMEVLHYITGLVTPASLGVGLTLDFRTMTFDHEPVVQDLACPICGDVSANYSRQP